MKDKLFTPILDENLKCNNFEFIFKVITEDETMKEME